MTYVLSEILNPTQSLLHFYCFYQSVYVMKNSGISVPCFRIYSYSYAIPRGYVCCLV